MHKIPVLLAALLVLSPFAARSAGAESPPEPSAADARRSGRLLTSPWCEPAPDGLPVREMADRVHLCLGAMTAVIQGIENLDRAMADVTAGEDLPTAMRRLREVSEHTQATVRAVEAGCPTPAEAMRLSQKSREQVAEWCARGDARALERLRELLRLLPPTAGQ